MYESPSILAIVEMFTFYKESMGAWLKLGSPLGINKTGSIASLHSHLRTSNTIRTIHSEHKMPLNFKQVLWDSVKCLEVGYSTWYGNGGH